MSDIRWEKRYEIGHERIDFEHQIFVDLIAKIDDAVHTGSKEGYIERLLNELRAYAVFHFLSEENIMYIAEYPEYEEHKRHHDELLIELGSVLAEGGLGNHEVENIVVFLKDWFVNHTLHEDVKISEFVKGKHI